MTVGKTKDVGYEIGVSKTVPHPIPKVWSLLTSPEGIALWLGEGAVLEPTKGAQYTTTTGTTGEIRGYEENDRVRLTWRPQNWSHDTTVQVRLSLAGSGKTVLRFHQEWLANSEERTHQRTHWQQVMEAVVAALDKKT